MNPLVLAVQGLDFGFAAIAVLGFIAYVAQNTDLNGPDDEEPDRIQTQNNALLQIIAAFVASGALDG